MTVDLSGPVAIQARILAIQDRFAAVAPAAAAVSSPATSQGDQSSFAATLAQLSPDTAAGTAPGAAGAESAALLGSGADALRGTTALASLGAVAGTAGASAPTGSQAVAAASRYLGVPYVWGGTDPATGLDCSGLVQRAYADLGVHLPRVAADQARCGQPVASLADARPGDLLAFGSPVDHIGIYAGGDSMVVAPKTGDVVKIERIYATPTAIRRILPDASATTGPDLATAGRALAGAPAAYRPLFTAAAQRYGVPADLLAAVARTESGFNASAVSGAGALGLMQLMPGTARSLGVDPMNPAQAVDGAARLLAAHQKKYGSTALALAAYNAGPGAVDRFGGVPPYRETQDYVARVLAAVNGVSA